MNFQRLLFLGLVWHCAQWVAESAPVPLHTVPNQTLRLPATSLTTNGLAGLTNLAPNLMVSAVVSNSLQGGTVSLVNTQEWVQRFNDSIYDVYNLAMVTDHAGNVVVTGTTRDPLGGDKLATIKYSPTGVALWTNHIAGPTNQESYGGEIGIDGNDNVFITGNVPGFVKSNQLVCAKYSSSGQPVWTNYFNSPSSNNSQTGPFTVSLDGNSYMGVVIFSGNLSISWITKYDSSGAGQWTNVYSGGFFPGLLATDANGNLFAAGTVPAIGDDIALVKYSGSGLALWTNQFDRALIDEPADMAIDARGNVIVTGDSMSSSNHSYVTIKYGNDGTPKWTNVIAGPSYQGGNVPEVVTDAHGNVFVTGGSEQAAYSNADFTILKLSSDGVPVWTNRFQEANVGNSAPAGTTVDNAGNFYLCGDSTGATGSNIDYFLVKYLADGTPQWTNRYNGPGNGSDYPNAVAVDHAGSVCVTGESQGISGAWDFATIKYADYLVYTPPANFIGTDTVTFTAVDQFGNMATNSVAVAVLPASLYFTPTTNLQFGGQGFQLQVDGASGSTPVVLLRSTDLMNWQPILTNFAVQGSVQFLDTNASGGRAFYQAMQVQ